MLHVFNFKIYFLTSMTICSVLITGMATAATTSTDSIRVIPRITNANIDSVSPTTNTPYTLSSGTGIAYIGSIGTNTDTPLSITTAGKLLKRNTQGPLIDYYQQDILGNASSDTNAKFAAVRNTYSVDNQEQIVATLNKVCKSNFRPLSKLDIKSYEVSYYALRYYEDVTSTSGPLQAQALSRWIISTEPNRIFTQRYVADWKAPSESSPQGGNGQPIPIWLIRPMPLPNETIITGLSLLSFVRPNTPVAGKSQFSIKAPASGNIGYISTPLPPEIYVTNASVNALNPPATDTAGNPIYWSIEKTLAFKRSYDLNKYDFNTIIIKVNYEWQIDCVATSAATP